MFKLVTFIPAGLSPCLQTKQSCAFEERTFKECRFTDLPEVDRTLFGLIGEVLLLDMGLLSCLAGTSSTTCGAKEGADSREVLGLTSSGKVEADAGLPAEDFLPEDLQKQMFDIFVKLDS